VRSRSPSSPMKAARKDRAIFDCPADMLQIFRRWEVLEVLRETEGLTPDQHRERERLEVEYRNRCLEVRRDPLTDALAELEYAAELGRQAAL
jgi:hypothetical protein